MEGVDLAEPISGKVKNGNEAPFGGLGGLGGRFGGARSGRRTCRG